MKIHEYQARELLRAAGIPVPPGRMIQSVEEAAAAFKETTAGMARPLAVVKAQVHAGGRGKAGFVKLVGTAEEAVAAARFMLSTRMRSPQTPPEGLEVTRLLVAQAVEIADRPPSRGAPGRAGSADGAGKEEFYLAITTDRGTRRNVLIASRQGGVDIEQVAHDDPGAILKERLHPLIGLGAYQARNVAFKLGFTGKQVAQAAGIMQSLARLYVEKDCTLAEINPLVITAPPSGGPAGGTAAESGTKPAAPQGQVVAIDAKFSFDENALFKHPEVAELADPAEENPAELRARRFGLSYVALDGNIGCLVNGAGLAMATMDIIKLHGGEPANFLDVGGSASEEAVTEAFSIILSDPAVKGILVNIFGGIMRCDVIAQGIVNAAGKVASVPGGAGGTAGRGGLRVPLVVRLEGTNVEAGRRILDAARTSIPTMQAATDLGDAAKKVCAAVGG